MTTPEEQPEALEGEETGDEFSRKKKSKFQAFKNLFAKKKKCREHLPPTEEPHLKPSQSNSDLSSPKLEPSLLPSPAETESNKSVGKQSLSQDGGFLSEVLPDVAGEASLQEKFPGEVKNLQQNPCLESPRKRMEDVGTISEDDGLSKSPPEISTPHDVLTSSATQASNPVQRCSSLSLEERDSEDEQVVSGSPSKHLSSLPLGSPASPLCRGLPVDFDSPASPLGCLNTSAARHRIAMNPRKQKGLAKKSHNLPVEQMLQEQHLLEPDEGKTSHSKFLEEAAGQKKDWEGLPSPNAVNANEDWTDSAPRVTRTSEVLPYSCSAGPHVDGTCVLISETQNLLETDLQVSITGPSPSVASPLIKCKEGNKADSEEMKRAWPSTDDQKPLYGPEVTENSDPFHLKTKAIGLHSASPSALLETKVGKELEAEDLQIDGSQLTDDRANVSKLARNRNRACDRSACGDSTVSLEADPVLYVPQLSSDVPKDVVHQNSLTVKQPGRRPSDMEFQLSQGPVKPTDYLQGALSTLEVEPARTLLPNAAGKKPYLPDLSCSVLSSNIRKPEDGTLQESAGFSSGRPFTMGSLEVASKTCPPVSTIGIQLGDVIIKKESQALEETTKTQTKSVPAKPVRFTIAPAWQRSLSGGSSSVDSSPTSPIRPELFEGISPLDALSQMSILSSPESLDPGNRNMAASLNSATEEAQSCERPFGVKLRRTSSLLKYQTEHHRDSPKVVPLPTSPASSANVRAKAPSSGTPLQSLPTGTKSLVANSTIQDKNLLQAKCGQGGPKEQASKPSEPAPAVPSGSLSSELAWISVAKTKQRGFPGHAFTEGEKKKEEAVAKTEKEQQASLSSDRSLQNSGRSQRVQLLESKVQSKSAVLAAKDGPVRILLQESPPVELRSAPILPAASCSPTEPPWLSLAKKKAKAWSEMPQTVQ